MAWNLGQYGERKARSAEELPSSPPRIRKGAPSTSRRVAAPDGISRGRGDVEVALTRRAYVAAEPRRRGYGGQWRAGFDLGFWGVELMTRAGVDPAGSDEVESWGGEEDWRHEGLNGWQIVRIHQAYL